MAVNHLVAFSASASGAAIVAGAPYGCNIAPGDQDEVCGSDPSGVDWPRLQRKMKRRMRKRAEDGLIDPPERLSGSRVYLFSGQADYVVVTDVMEQVRAQLSQFTGPDSIRVDYEVNATHGWVVDGHTCGEGEPGSIASACGRCCCSPSSLLACEGVDLAGRFLGHLLGPLPQAVAPPAPARRSRADDYDLIEVRQERYVPADWTLDSAGLWHTAYVYAPIGCKFAPNLCPVHVHYHGCVWGAEYTGTDLLKRLGILDYAEAYGMIVLFPQASSTVDSGGCWDWTGETTHHFDTQEGPQLATVAAMLADLPRILWRRDGTAAEIVV